MILMYMYESIYGILLLKKQDEG